MHDSDNYQGQSLCYLSCTCKEKRTDSSISLYERQVKECFCSWQSLLSSSLLVITSVVSDVTCACIKLLSVGMASLLHIYNLLSVGMSKQELAVCL